MIFFSRNETSYIYWDILYILKRPYKEIGKNDLFFYTRLVNYMTYFLIFLE